MSGFPDVFRKFALPLKTFGTVAMLFALAMYGLRELQFDGYEEAIGDLCGR